MNELAEMLGAAAEELDELAEVVAELELELDDDDDDEPQPATSAAATKAGTTARFQSGMKVSPLDTSARAALNFQ